MPCGSVWRSVGVSRPVGARLPLHGLATGQLARCGAMGHGRSMAIRQERPMSKPSGLLAALCLLGVTLSAGQAARAQEAGPAASLTPGTKVYDQDGQEVGQRSEERRVGKECVSTGRSWW